MKTAIKKLSILTLLAGLAGSAQAVQVFSYNTPVDIPDGFQAGVSIPFTLSGLESSITDLTVKLNIGGTPGVGPGITGDLYVYLKNNEGTGTKSVLLNRVGDAGYGNDGFDVTFTMAATPDIHLYQETSPEPVYANDRLTGTWSADGRDSDPNFVNTVDPRNAKLDVFQGVNPNGNWTLFLADYDGGGTSTLNSFSIDMVAVPEPAQTALAFAGLLFGLVLYRQPQVRARLTSLVRR